VDEIGSVIIQPASAISVSFYLLMFLALTTELQKHYSKAVSDLLTFNFRVAHIFSLSFEWKQFFFPNTDSNEDITQPIPNQQQLK